MACEGCEQKNKGHEDVSKTKAQRLANETGKWVGIYTEGNEIKFAIGDECRGKPIERHYSPEKNLS